MSSAVNVGDIQISVGSQMEAAKLREDFAELTARVNIDLRLQKFSANDPINVEMTISQAERSIDYHLQVFADSDVLQSLAPEIKRLFRVGIEAQVPTGKTQRERCDAP